MDLAEQVRAEGIENQSARIKARLDIGGRAPSGGRLIQPGE